MMDKFLEDMAEVLEVASIKPEDDFRAVPMWSSLVGFSVIVMLEQRYQRIIALADLENAKTVADLARLAGVNG